VGQQLTQRIIIQSNSKDPHYLDQRTELFLQTYRATIENLSTDDFQSNVQAVVEQLLEKPKNLSKVLL
jgi:insulysin